MSVVAQQIAERRCAWRRLLGAALKLAERAEATEGRETVEADHFAHDLARTGKLRFDADGDVATQISTAFLITARGMLNAGYARRRAILAPALAALARAGDQLLTEQADREAAVWKRQTGED